MQSFFHDNRYFFILLALFLAGGTVLLNNIALGEEILFFSERRTDFLNLFFKKWTLLGEGMAFVFLIVVLLFVRYRYAVLFSVMGLFTLLTSFLLKMLFEHPRPKAYFEDNGLIDQLNFVEGIYVNAGPTGFPSGHTMGAFALFALLAFLSKEKTWFAVLCFFAALLVGISRMYLVQHFFKDVYLGALLGVIIATLIYSWESYIQKKDQPWGEGKLGRRRKLKTG